MLATKWSLVLRAQDTFLSNSGSLFGRSNPTHCQPMCLLYRPHPSHHGLQGGGPDSDVGYQSMCPGRSDWLRDWFVTNMHQLESVPGLLLEMLYLFIYFCTIIDTFY